MTKEEWKTLPEKTKISFQLLAFAGVMFLIISLMNFPEGDHVFNTDLVMRDFNNSTLFYEINIEMSAPIFAVDTPIFVNATVRPNMAIPSKHIAILFDGSHIIPHQKRDFGNSLYAGKVDAELRTENIYVGTAKIDYDMDGCHDIKITSYEHDRILSLHNETKNCNFIHIQPSDATNINFYNKYLVSLTMAMLILSFVSIIPAIRTVYDDLILSKEKQKKKENKNQE